MCVTYLLRRALSHIYLTKINCHWGQNFILFKTLLWFICTDMSLLCKPVHSCTRLFFIGNTWLWLQFKKTHITIIPRFFNFNTEKRIYDKSHYLASATTTKVIYVIINPFKSRCNILLKCKWPCHLWRHKQVAIDVFDKN